MDLPPIAEVMEVARRKIPVLEEFLLGLVGIPSVYGHEGEAQTYIRKSFEKMGTRAREVPIGEDLRKDPEYTHSEDTVPYDGRPNLVIEEGGEGFGNSLILNTHSDVVPAGSWEDGFNPKVEDGMLAGRGAVDCKGHVGAVFLLFELLEEFGVELSGKLYAQVVIEEEIGGNGSLSLIRQGYIADGVVVLEGTDLTVCPANRGALWFKATVRGRPVHMAKKYEGVSAIDKSIDFIRLLYDYEGRLAEGSSGQPLFSEYAHPVQVNIGRMNAGDWPATVPGTSVLEGG
ncbi:MAG: M20/M25/M40 family metallo-hydrolase, partial [Theionarchaea archaeon]|nr:M20/M25/M40 family metallo-hydrolase [Theionarchaea archaeon]